MDVAAKSYWLTAQLLGSQGVSATAVASKSIHSSKETDMLFELGAVKVETKQPNGIQVNDTLTQKFP
jgi:hypothetical protein